MANHEGGKEKGQHDMDQIDNPDPAHELNIIIEALYFPKKKAGSDLQWQFLLFLEVSIVNSFSI